MKIEFFVPGNTEPAGSKRGLTYKDKATGHTRVAIVDQNDKNLKKWRPIVQMYAGKAMAGRLPLDGPVKLVAHFVRQRPKSHYGKKGILPSARDYPEVAPDSTKLVRALEDCMNKVVWRDDSQVCIQIVTKTYGERPGVHVRVETIDPKTKEACNETA